MKIIVHQSIFINTIKIEGISNSSILQIGSAGIIKAQSNLYNTGGYTGPAPQPRIPFMPISPIPPERSREPVAPSPPLVPF